MMWEWRVFFPSGTKQLDIWEVLHLKPWSLFPEKRTDVYIVCTTGAGVKLRGKRTLEVKLRGGQHALGAELWDKVLYTPLKWDGSDTRALGDMIAQTMTTEREWIATKDASTEKRQSLEDVFTLNSEPLNLISLSKHRISHHLRGVGIEQTDITVDCSQLERSHWRTINLEGDLEDILKLLQSTVQVEAGSSTTLREHLMQVAGPPCGYPEFVVRLQQELLDQ